MKAPGLSIIYDCSWGKNEGGPMAPMTIEEWLAVGKERGVDAEAILKDRPASTGSVYMAGYAIECNLKAYLMLAGKAFPSAGAAGHDLGNLWKVSGFRKSDIAGDAGCTTFFFDSWSTSLRYMTMLEPLGIPIQDLVNGAKTIARWIDMQAKRQLKTRRRRY